MAQRSQEFAIRAADASDVSTIAALWHGGWHDAHAAIVPADLVAMRTPQSFLERTRQKLANLTVGLQNGEIRGICAIKGAELNQLFVAPEARGTGLARALLSDGEARLAANGVARAWLACAIGNARAARFYEKSGWAFVGTVMDEVEAVNATYPLSVWRYEKVIGHWRAPAEAPGPDASG